MEFVQERMAPVISEVARLIKAHWLEVANHQDKIKLDPAWHKYKEVEQLGLLRFYSARVNGVMVGYAIFMVVPLLHYQNHVAASNDVVFIHPKFRAGRDGVRFLKFCHDKLKAEGVHKIVWHIKPHMDWSPILKRMGYTQEEFLMGMYVGD